MGIAGTGALMRYVVGIDASGAKQLAMGLISFNPVIPEGIGLLFFYTHLSGLHPAGILPLQQINARGRHFLFSNPNHAQQQPGPYIMKTLGTIR